MICRAPAETLVVLEPSKPVVDASGTHPSWLTVSEPLNESEKFVGVVVRFTTKD